MLRFLTKILREIKAVSHHHFFFFGKKVAQTKDEFILNKPKYNKIIILHADYSKDISLLIIPTNLN